MHVAVMTMARNEATMLPRWLRHYGGEVGERNLYVLDDKSDDGSTAGLRATVITMPRRSTASPRLFGVYKASLANKLAACLLEMYDVVIFTDVDEFLVPDPRHYRGLMDYLAKNSEQKVIAPIGLNLIHRPELEPALDPHRPLLTQRRHVKIAPGMCKPAIKRVPARWTGGTHGISAEYGISRDVLLLHAKYVDRDMALRTQEARHTEYLDSQAGKTATWRMEPAALAARWGRWSRARTVPVIDFETVDLAGIVRVRPNGVHRSYGPQSEAMESGALYRLPDWLTDQV